MRYNQLGNSGLLVSELGLGSGSFGETAGWGADPKEAVRMIHRFLDAGGNHIDTANNYAAGRAESIVGEAVHGRRDDIVLATKVRFKTGLGPNDVGLSRYQVRRSVEQSLRRLQTDRIDLLYVHAWDPLTPIEETLRAFDDLVGAGKVNYIGVSNFKVWHLMKTLGISDAHGWARFVAAQYPYSLVMREIEPEFVDLALNEGIGIVPWGPLGGGFLTGKHQAGNKATEGTRLALMEDEAEHSWVRRNVARNWKILDAVRSIADATGRTLPQVALAWVAGRPGVVSTLIGARTMEQLEDNLGSVTGQLSEEDTARLDAASALEPGYPERYLARFTRS